MKNKKIIALFLVISVLLVQTAYAQVLSGTTSVTLDLRLQPTSLVITPKTVSVPEGSNNVQFVATAKYEFPGLTTPIPDRDVSDDPLIVWSSSATSVAIVNTQGLVTPVSDLNQGSATATISASYAGLSDTGVITVTGVVPPPPPPPSSGGGGGGGALIFTVTPPTTVTPPPTTPPPTTTPDEPETPWVPIEEPGTPSVPEVPTTPSEPETPISPDTPSIPDTPTNPEVPNIPETPTTGTDTPVVTETPTTPLNPVTPDGTTTTTPNGNTDSTNQIYIPPTIPMPSEIYVVSPDLPNSVAVITPEQIEKLKALPDIAIRRSDIAAKIGNDLGLFKIREKVLNRCFADLENCTNIFRMRSKFDGINLDPNNLVLFPDIAGDKNEDAINKMALLGILNGYYNSVLDGKASPFVPEAPIINAEMMKILTSALAVAEGDNVYPTLFYQDIYAIYLLKTLNGGKFALNWWWAPKVAFAELTDQEQALIKGVKTIFADIAPDKYDAHWYYPIVYNRVCELKILDCQPGMKVSPDDFPKSEEVERIVGMFVDKINSEQIVEKAVSDDDKDQLENLDERLIYFTDPEKFDTDEDKISDGDEVLKYKTDPNFSDSDKDGLSDFEEITQYKTDPFLPDSDGDSYPDIVEVKGNSNPLDATSLPGDINQNNIEDNWEARYSIEVINGSQDSDNDGVSDVLEYKYATDPTKIDSDGDGFTDSEEVLTMNTDPNDAASPGSDVRDLPVKITNFTYGQLVDDDLPIIKGIAPASLGENSVKVQLLLRNEFGSELFLGATDSDAKGGFLFEPTIKLKDGVYFLLARAIVETEVRTSDPIKIVVDSKLQVEQAKLEKLEDQPITEEVLVKNLFLDVNTPDGRPTLYGNLTEVGSRVNVTWKSVVLSSALIADADGAFAIKAPRLEEGQHSVFIQTIRKKDNAMSKTIKINFVLGVTGNDLGDGGDVLKGSLDERLGALGGVGNFVSRQGIPFWIGLVIVLALVGGGIYYFVLNREDEEVEKKK